MALRDRLREVWHDPYTVALLLLLTVALIARIPLLLTGATEEDVYITLRYAANIAQGVGFVYNPGEHVLGTTTPLYTLWLALLFRLHLNALLGGKLLGIACDLLTALGAYRLGRAVGRPGVGLGAAWAVALFPLNLTWAARGMEVGPVAAAIMGSFLGQILEKELVTWFCAALLLLLRVDGGVLALFLLGDSLLRLHRFPWKGLLLFCLIVLPWLVFATIYFGSFIPTSVPAKLIVYSREYARPLPQLKPFLSHMLMHPFEGCMSVGCILAILQAVWGFVHKETTLQSQNTNLLASLLWMLTYYAAMAFSPVFLFGWYFVPPSPLFYFWGMLGWFALGARLLPNRFRLSPLVATALASLLLATVTVPYAYRTLKRAQMAEQRLRLPIGVWLHTHAHPYQTLMLEPIGYIGYFSGLRVLDTVGLVSPQVLPFYAKRYPSPLHALWSHFLPDFVLLRAGEYQMLVRYERTLPFAERLEGHYRLIHVWHDPSHPMAVPAFYLFRRSNPL
ncbi:hypothetical protein CTKA_02202 [Chthonomonas calidirosea]|uniref:4-amino-4-deoxy-L-arabinose transferase and related glycosyltransferases of PMT family n=1 Tax=Chthonomonas calidirosea (strain DSM 23976 / ICMP 18418 / T49) TaxID=1303518 RepID=S0EZD6_CHTCT|nr:hypothetical protein [Chthonomonas calidirosea]CCW35702.1 hypothetical protein CCALI_01893 [Chthonomonas calidirosea T49]CEK19491.1 hypothetical protein CTKA_02202 [Chthonomonas calidirosea]